MPGGIHYTFRSALVVFSLFAFNFHFGRCSPVSGQNKQLTDLVCRTDTLQDPQAWVKSSRNLSRLQLCFGFGKSALSLVCLKNPWTQITLWTECDSNKFSGPSQQSSSGFPSGFSMMFLRKKSPGICQIWHRGRCQCLKTQQSDR